MCAHTGCTRTAFKLQDWKCTVGWPGAHDRRLAYWCMFYAGILLLHKINYAAQLNLTSEFTWSFIGSKSNVNATVDFIEVALAGHAVCAAMEVLGIEKISDQPDDIPSPETYLSEEEKKRVLSAITHAIVSQFVNLTTTLQQESEAPRSKRRKRKSKSNKPRDDGSVDGVLEYSREFLTLGMVHAEFSDSIREGDGIRVLR